MGKSIYRKKGVSLSPIHSTFLPGSATSKLRTVDPTTNYEQQTQQTIYSGLDPSAVFLVRFTLSTRGELSC